MENGRIIIWKGREFILGRTENSMRGITRKVGRKGLVFISGRMGADMRVTGVKGFSMAKVNELLFR